MGSNGLGLCSAADGTLVFRSNRHRTTQAGSERFYPVTGDFATHEMEKCARILRAFTVEGIGATVEQVTPDGKKQQKKVIRKIPASIIRQAKGIVIFTSMRSGIAPFGGAGGAGVILARLEDGSWSAPSATTPNNLSAGLMLGVDVYDCVLIGKLRSLALRRRVLQARPRELAKSLCPALTLFFKSCQCAPRKP